MIYIKTEMPDMPKGCLQCDEYLKETCKKEGSCVANYKYKRPSWCPLVEMEESK